jgi:hypothetical protein
MGVEQARGKNGGYGDEKLVAAHGISLGLAALLAETP